MLDNNGVLLKNSLTFPLGSLKLTKRTYDSRKEKIMNKRGQVGETITWVIATLLLIAILLLFIYASIAMAKTKYLNLDIKLSSGNSVDWINSKTQMAYSISSVNKNKIQVWISQKTEYE
jgi:hypothetical protein